MHDHLIDRTDSAYSSPLLIKHLLNHSAAANSGNSIVYRDRLQLSYPELQERIARLANALKALGVKAGDTVAVMDYDSHRYLECFFAVPMLGAVLHTINVRLSPEQMLYTIEHAEDDALLVHSDFLPLLEPIKGRIDTVKKFVLINEDDAAPATGIEFVAEYESMLRACPPLCDFPDFDENTRATTFFTTGTTGMPKGVSFSHRQLVLHTLTAMAALGTAGHGNLHQGDVYMPLTPMFHVHAWGLPYVATALGVKQVYPGRYTPEALLKLIDSEGVTFSHCVPTILHMLLSHPLAERVDLSQWKVIIGGSALPRALCLAALQRGIDIFTGYGMSETCPILTLAHLSPDMKNLSREEQIDIRCKTGRPLPLVDVQLVDEQMQQVPNDGRSVGEIVVRAPWLTQSYLKDHKNSENLWRGGYLHTGDVASRDSRGYLKISDRTKDIIKVGGEWVSSLELEDVLCHHPAVQETAVIGRADAKWGELPLALTVLKPEPGKDVSEKKLLAYLRDFVDKGILSKYALLTRIRFVEAIDKTSVGKTDKKALRAKYLAEQ
ncbi:MAG: fatty acid--CoA ligase [Pedobacter sp.]